MALARPDSSGTETVGYKRGNFEWTLKELDRLKIGQEVDSKLFEAGGFKWKLVICLVRTRTRKELLLRNVLISCNPNIVSACFGLTVLGNGFKSPMSLLENGPKEACPFHVLDKHDIPMGELTEGLGYFQPDHELTFDVELKDIREGTPDEQRNTGNDARCVGVEVVCFNSIRDWLNKRKAFGVADPTRTESFRVCRCSLIRPWSEQCPDHRYWLCKRMGDGNVRIESCLNLDNYSECFDNHCEENGEGHPCITVFREEKDISTTFKSVGDDDIIVFCKFWEPPYKDLSYLGHRLLKKTMKCPDLLPMVAAKMAHIPDDKDFDCYLEVHEHKVKDITLTDLTLEECGFHSGSSVIWRLRESEAKDLAETSVQEALRALHGYAPIADSATESEDVAVSSCDSDISTGTESEDPLPLIGQTVDQTSASTVEAVHEQSHSLHAHVAVNERAVYPLRMSNNCPEDEPVFLLVQDMTNSLTVALTSTCQSDADNVRVCYISVKPSDGVERRLEITETKKLADGTEVVAAFPVKDFQSFKLNNGCPLFGSPEDKYAEVRMRIGFQIAEHELGGDAENCSKMEGRFWCLPVSSNCVIAVVMKAMQLTFQRKGLISPRIRNLVRGVMTFTHIVAEVSKFLEPLNYLGVLLRYPLNWRRLPNAVVHFLTPAFFQNRRAMQDARVGPG